CAYEQKPQPAGERREPEGPGEYPAKRTPCRRSEVIQSEFQAAHSGQWLPPPQRRIMGTGRAASAFIARRRSEFCWDRSAWTTGQFGPLRTATNEESALDTFNKLYRLFENTGVNFFPATT